MYWENKKTLVTGGAGVIGRELINEIVNLKAKVLCIDREPRPEDMPSAVEYCRADISQMDTAVITDFEPEVIFHLAASFERTEETPEFWDVNFRDNIIVSHRVIDAAIKLNNLRKFIFASSYLVFSPTLYLFPSFRTEPAKLKETDPVVQRNLCGAAKYYTEKELEFMNISHRKFIAISARIFRVYGRGSRDVVSRWIRAALNNEELVVFQKENLFDYIFAGDVASGLIKTAEKVNNKEIVNLGSGRASRIEQVIQTIKAQIPNAKVRKKEVTKDKLFEASCADMSKFTKLIGWKPQTSLEEGTRKIIDYEKDHPSEA